MNNIYKYKTSQGLNVIYVYKKNFKTSYCGIGTKYGGANLNFTNDNIIYKSKEGTAHFIEHQLFKMADGSDAVKKFSKLYTTNNAYTQTDKTIYYFKTTADIYAPLKLLLNMYFEANFDSKYIENEKSIIISEMEMYNDNPGFRIINEILNLTYPNDDFSKPVIGNYESINQIKVDDLKLIHRMFYTPKNSVLCIVGSEDYNKIFKAVEDYLSQIKLSFNNPIKHEIITSKVVKEGLEIIEDVYQREIYISLRFDNITSKDPISCDKILIILDSLFNVSSSFYKYLEEKDLFIADIDFEVHTFLDSSYALIHAPSNNPFLLIEEIINKIRNFNVNDIDKRITDINIKHLIADSILEMDDVQRLGDKILSLELEDINYRDLKNQIANLKIEDLLEYLNDIKNSLITYLIVNPKEEMA